MAIKSFVLKSDNLTVLENLTDEEAGNLFKAIKLHLEGVDVKLDFPVDLAFQSFISQAKKPEKKAAKKVTQVLPGIHTETMCYRSFDHLSMTYADFDKLIAQGYTEQQIDDILDEIWNKPRLNKNYRSLYQTARSWLKKSQVNAKAPMINRQTKSDIVNNLNPKKWQ